MTSRALPVFAAAVRRSSPLRGLRASGSGLIVIVVSILVAIASFTSEANLLLLLFGMAIAVVAFNAVTCVQTVRSIDVERGPVVAAVAGRPFRLVYTIRHRKRWFKSWVVRIGETPVAGRAPLAELLLAVLRPGEERRVELKAVCPNRGRLALRGIRVSCGFPFGLFTCTVDIEAPAELIVFPAAGRVRREFWHQQALAESPDARRQEHAAGQDEFHGVREYRQGDNPRWIHWRRSAHTGQLVVREHQPVRDSQLVVLLDPWPESPPAKAVRRGLWQRLRGTPGDPRPDPTVERMISAAATVVCEALDRGYRVGMIARGVVPVVLAPAGGRAQRQRILNELALLSPGAERSFDQMIQNVRWCSGSNARCVLLTVRSHESHARLLRILSGRTASVMLITPQSGWLDKLFDLSGTVPERRRTA